MPKFLKEFKNPCFYDNYTSVNGTVARPNGPLRCVHYFMIAGFPKSSTTDLWFRLSKHPELKLKHRKEIGFYNIHQFGKCTRYSLVNRL